MTTTLKHPLAQEPGTRRRAVADAVSGRRMVRRYLLGESKLVTPTLGEPALATLVLLWTGLAFLPAFSWPTLTPAGPLAAAIGHNTPLLWVLGLWGVTSGAVQLAGWLLAWTGQVFPHRRWRIAAAISCSLYHVAILWVFTEGGASFPIGPYLALFAWSLGTLGAVVKNGHHLEAVLRACTDSTR